MVGGPGVERELTIAGIVGADVTVTVDEDTGKMEDWVVFVVEVSGFGVGLDIEVMLETAKELDD